MNFTFMLPLEDMAVVRTAIMLWNHEDNRILLKKNFSTNDMQKTQRVWLEVEDKIIENVTKLLLPKSLENKLLDIIKPIGIEMLKWSLCHENVLKTDRKIVRQSLKKLCWTAQGTVDRKKTAEILIYDKNFKISNRYKLACIYCLEYDIPKLWNEMSESERKKTETLFYCQKFFESTSSDGLVIFWTYYIKGDLAEMKDMIITSMIYKIYLRRYTDYSSDCFMFEMATLESKSATEYFFKKLNCTQKEELLVSAAKRAASTCICIDEGARTSVDHHPYQCNSEVLFFLLSQMSNSRLQAQVCQSDAVLQCLLDWPWQSFFEETANRLSKSYLVCDPNNVLSRIIDKLISGYRDYNYQKLFREICQLGRDDLDGKSAFYDFLYGRYILSKLIIVDDKENFELILNEATPSLREEFIFSDEGMKTCESLISEDKWDSVKFFIQKCILCKSKIDKFKVIFNNCIISQQTERKRKTEEKNKWNKFFTLVDHLAQEMNTKISQG